MKKNLLYTLALIISVCLFSCGSDDDSGEINPPLITEDVLIIIKEPDLKVYIEDLLETYDTDYNGKLSSEEAKFIEKIQISDFETKYGDLIGIQYFTGIKYLSITENTPDGGLSSGPVFKNIDLSYNTKLQEIYIGRINISSINLGENSNLTRFHYNGVFSKTKLNNLDISKCKNLENFQCYHSDLEKFDFSNNLEINRISIGNNRFATDLNLTKNLNLDWLYLVETPNLEVDLSQNIQLTGLKLNQFKGNSLDLTNNVNLNRIELFNNDAITNLNLSENIRLSYIHIDRMQNLKTISVWNRFPYYYPGYNIVSYKIPENSEIIKIKN